LRNGSEAVTLATRAVELSATNNPTFLDTLAAAYAEAGQFAAATATAQEAQAAALRQGRQDLAEHIRQRLALYGSGHPYREAAGAR
jgi:Flp pilus assembly protein TadD